MKLFLKGLFVVTLLISASSAFAERIEFPEDELATETVLPKFDRPTVVRNRNVVTEGRFEPGLFSGWIMNEPFYNNQQIGLNLSYHFNEISAVNVVGASWMSGASTYGKQLKEQNYVDVDNTYGPKSMYLLNYQFTGFYGKISLTKQAVVNLSLFGLMGIGMVNYEGLNSPAFTFGLGQKFYFTPAIALRFDLRMLAYQGPNPVSLPTINLTTKPAISDFEKSTYLSTVLNVGLVFLL